MRWNIDAGTSTEMRWNIDVQKNCAGTSTIVVPARFVGVPLRLSVFQILDLVMEILHDEHQFKSEYMYG